MVVRHEQDELSEQLCGPAEADGPGRADPPAGGRHLGRLVWANLGKGRFFHTVSGHKVILSWLEEEFIVVVVAASRWEIKSRKYQKVFQKDLTKL